jgi:hypothetical protein
MYSNKGLATLPNRRCECRKSFCARDSRPKRKLDCSSIAVVVLLVKRKSIRNCAFHRLNYCI